jgi:hypothetical protein
VAREHGLANPRAIQESMSWRPQDSLARDSH